MTAPVPDVKTYADFSGLDALKRGAQNQDPKALRETAQQFESIFARMMIKSMRDASFGDKLLGSDQQDFYQGMFDDQLSVDITRGRGLGLADMLVHQLQRAGVAPAATADPAAKISTPAPPAAAAAPAASTTPPVSPAQRANFISQLLPSAQQAGEQLGVDPRHLIAQAALETNWGQSVPRDPSGRSSNNLFGVKAGTGAASSGAVAARTTEYEQGTAVSRVDQFRSYASPSASFQDYVAMLRGNSRYAAALNTGTDTHAFASALQQGGYATDPNYAHKIASIAGQLLASVRPLKSDGGLPMNLNSNLL
jgi:peptidoglycan hydrolase FlgJ